MCATIKDKAYRAVKLLYDDIFSYSQSGVSYSGGLGISVPTISNPVSVGTPGVVFVSEIDYSNNSTVGVVSMDYVSSSIVLIETNQSNLSANIYQTVTTTPAATVYIEYLN